MKRLKRALLWCVTLQKRFLTRPAFLGILLLIPLLSLSLSAAAGGEKGMVTVALCPGMDDVSEAVVESLRAEGGVVRWIVCADGEEARAIVRNGKADAAWIFAEDTDRALLRHAEGRRAVAVTVVEREDNVLLMLSREKLYAALFPEISLNLLRVFLERESGEALSEETLREARGGDSPDRALIRVTSMDGAETMGEGDYVLSPLRGLLSVLVLLGGLAAGTVLQRDRENGLFVWVHPSDMPLLEAAYLLFPMLDLALAALVALWLAGMTVHICYELLLMLLLVLGGTGFCGLITRFCRTAERTGAAALLLTLCMLALCPVFFNLRRLRLLSSLLPPYHYLHAVYNTRYALSLGIYTGAVWALNALWGLAQRVGRSLPRKQ